MPYKDKAKQREAQRRWAKNNRSTVSRNSHQTRKKHAAIVEEHKKVPCADCGEKYPPYVMDFDHVGADKVLNVAAMVGRGWALRRILDEIAKCEVVCSNCHRERTYKRSALAL